MTLTLIDITMLVWIVAGVYMIISHKEQIKESRARTKAMVDFTIAVAEGNAKVIQNITLAPDTEVKQ